MSTVPPLDPKMVQEFVGVSHGDFARVTAMLAEEPRLVNACWDWGGGDFETALGAASHTAQREIALCLLENGARLDLFAAAMLGYEDVLRAALAHDPRLVHVKGPHGIPLLAHAATAKQDAVVELLKQYGAEG